MDRVHHAAGEMRRQRVVVTLVQGEVAQVFIFHHVLVEETVLGAPCRLDCFRP